MLVHPQRHIQPPVDIFIKGLVAQMSGDVLPGLGQEIDGPTTDYYKFNDASLTLADCFGNVQPMPKHRLCSAGDWICQNLFQREGVDWTDVSGSWRTGVGVTLTYEGNGVFLAEGFDNVASSTDLSIEIDPLASAGRTFAGLVEVQSVNANDVIGFESKRFNGGTSSNNATSVTLSDEWQSVYSGTWTGNASNNGVQIAFIQPSGGTTVTSFRFRFPAIIEWLSGQDTSKPPLPESLAFDTPMGSNFFIGGTGTGWTDNGDGTYTHTVGQSANLDVTHSTVAGRKYVFSITVSGRTAGSVTPALSGGSEASGSAITSNGLSAQILTSNGNTTLRVYVQSAFDGTIEVTVHEATFGFYASNREPNTSVTSGVISGDMNGTEYYEMLNRRLTLKNGRTIAFQTPANYPEVWTAAASPASGKRVLPTDHQTNYNQQFVFESDGGGATGGTEPDWSTATAVNDTVTDNEVTWTAKVYHTHRRAPILPAATNEFTRPEEFDHAAWIKTRATITADSAIAPDGSRSADTLGDDSSTGTGTVYTHQNVAVTSGNTQIVSIFAKSKQLSWLAIESALFDATEATYFDLTNGAVGTSAHGDAGVEGYGNGWYRCWIAFSSTTDVNGIVRFYVADADGDVVVDLDGTSDIYVWGAQTEEGKAPTAYIKTVASTVSRTTMAGALKYSDANWLDTDSSIFAVLSHGIAMDDFSGNQGVVSLNDANVTRGIYFNSAAQMKSTDGTAATTIDNWSAPANEIMITALSVSSADDDQSIYARSGGTDQSDANQSKSYDDAIGKSGGNAVIGQTVTHPMNVGPILLIPRGSVSNGDVLAELDDTLRFAA